MEPVERNHKTEPENISRLPHDNPNSGYSNIQKNGKSCTHSTWSSPALLFPIGWLGCPEQIVDVKEVEGVKVGSPE